MRAGVEHEQKTKNIYVCLYMYCIYKYIYIYIYIYMYIYMERYDMTRCCTVRCCICLLMAVCVLQYACGSTGNRRQQNLCVVKNQESAPQGAPFMSCAQILPIGSRQASIGRKQETSLMLQILAFNEQAASIPIRGAYHGLWWNNVSGYGQASIGISCHEHPFYYVLPIIEASDSTILLGSRK